MEHGLAAIGVLFLIYHLGFDLSQMSSGSMEPTLQGRALGDGDWVLTEKISYWFRRPRRWEIVTFRTPEGLQVMKRVVGLPGEWVAVCDGHLWITGDHVPFPASLSQLHYYDYGSLQGGNTVACDNGYFVLGDDSKDSDDSRYNGPLERKQMIGRAVLIVGPRSRWSWLAP